MALRVLLADNSESIRRVIQLALQDFGVEVKTIGHALDVIEVARNWKPDIVLVDILLQKQSGYAVAQTVKDDPELAQIPVILMWSGFMDFDEQKAKQTRAEGRLEKPFDSEGLRSIMLQFVPRLRQHPLGQFITPTNFAKTAMKSSTQEEQAAPAASALGAPPAPTAAQVPNVPATPNFGASPASQAPPQGLGASPRPSILAPLSPEELPDDMPTQIVVRPQSAGSNSAPGTPKWNMESFDPVPLADASADEPVLPELELDLPATHESLLIPIAAPGDDNFFQDIEEVTRVNAQLSENPAFIDPLDLDEPEQFAHVPLAPLKNLTADTPQATPSSAPPKKAEPLASRAQPIEPQGFTAEPIQDLADELGGNLSDAEGDWQRQDIQTFQLDIPNGADAGEAVVDPDIRRGGPAFYDAQTHTHTGQVDSTRNFAAVNLDEHLLNHPKGKSPEDSKPATPSYSSAAQQVPIHKSIPQDPSSPAQGRTPVTRSSATIHPSLRPQQPPPPIQNPAANVTPATVAPATMAPASTAPANSPLQRAAAAAARATSPATGNELPPTLSPAPSKPSSAGSAPNALLPREPSESLIAPLKPQQVEEFLRVQGADIIREIAQRIIPEIATEMIKQEIQRLLDESVPS
jgi:CheY-like chemotaxis protein